MKIHESLVYFFRKPYDLLSNEGIKMLTEAGNEMSLDGLKEHVKDYARLLSDEVESFNKMFPDLDIDTTPQDTGFIGSHVWRYKYTQAVWHLYAIILYTRMAEQK